MPIVQSREYLPPLVYKNRHVNTIFNAFFRPVSKVRYLRERIPTPDRDFMDLDYSLTGSDKLGVVLHGLEGSSASTYVRGMVRALNRAGYDAVAVNFRGCGGEDNRHYYSYHSGKSEDLRTVLEHLGKNTKHEHLFVVGYSVGGNIALKYSGESGKDTHGKLRSLVGISVPTDLEACAYHLAKPAGSLYKNHILDSLKEKAILKKKKYPEAPFTIEEVESVKDFYEFDNLYTAASHGFRDANDYWAKANSKQYLADIKLPSLLINALDDPFLPDACHPYEEAEKNPNFFFEPIKHGGHVGFISSWRLGDDFWHEKRTIRFFENML